MSYDFTANEIFEAAILIEKSGANFYRRAAELQTNQQNRDFLQKLAAMEDAHETAFVEMQKGVTEAEKSATVFDPYDESSMYLAAMADSHGGEGSPLAANALTGQETMEEILTIAIGLEKESILFYLGLRDLVPPKLGQVKVDSIIKEERKHVIQLYTLLRKQKSS